MDAHRVHDRRTRRDRAAAQIVAIGEAARQHDGVAVPAGNSSLGVPHHRGLAARNQLSRARHIALRSIREDDDGGFHGSSRRGGHWFWHFIAGLVA